MQEARETLLIAARTLEAWHRLRVIGAFVRPMLCMRVYTAQPLKAEQMKGCGRGCALLWLWQNFVDGRPRVLGV